MRFKPFVFNKANQQIPVSICLMSPLDAAATDSPTAWQTSWTSKYLDDERFDMYAAKINDELIALGAYEILENALVVHLAYMEAHPASNPTLDGGIP